MVKEPYFNNFPVSCARLSGDQPFQWETCLLTVPKCGKELERRTSWSRRRRKDRGTGKRFGNRRSSNGGR